MDSSHLPCSGRNATVIGHRATVRRPTADMRQAERRPGINLRPAVHRQNVCIARVRLLASALAFVLTAGTSFAADNASVPQVQFNRDVRPILSDKCFQCHGPDAKKREADLRLDVRDVAVAAGAIAPHRPHESCCSCDA